MLRSIYSRRPLMPKFLYADLALGTLLTIFHFVRAQGGCALREPPLWRPVTSLLYHHYAISAGRIQLIWIAASGSPRYLISGLSTTVFKRISFLTKKSRRNQLISYLINQTPREKLRYDVEGLALRL